MDNNIEKTLNMIADIAGIDLFLQNQNTSLNTTRRKFFAIPESLQFVTLLEEHKSSIIRSIASISNPQEGHYFEYGLTKSEWLDRVRANIHNLIDEEEYFEFVDEMLASPIAEILLFTSSNNGLVRLSELSNMLHRLDKKAYTKLDPEAIAYTLFMSSEFESSVPTKAFVGNESVYTLTIQKVLSPILTPFVNKPRKMEALLTALSQYSIISYATIQVSKLVNASTVTIERIIVFEHVMAFVTHHIEMLQELGVSQSVLDVFNLNLLPGQMMSAHPILADFFFRPMLDMLRNLDAQVEQTNSEDGGASLENGVMYFG